MLLMEKVGMVMTNDQFFGCSFGKCTAYGGTYVVLKQVPLLGKLNDLSESCADIPNIYNL